MFIIELDELSSGTISPSGILHKNYAAAAAALFAGNMQVLCTTTIIKVNELVAPIRGRNQGLAITRL